MNSKNIFFQLNYYNFSVLFLLFIHSAALYSQIKIGIAPGESEQINREHTISILPITNVTIKILGADSSYIAGTVDSFKVMSGILKIKTYYTLLVTLSAPIRELSIQVLLVFHADNVLSQSVQEEFLIDTSVQPNIVANFTANPREGFAPLDVNFTNESTGNIIGYFWDFGDSMTSSEQNPYHTYLNAGTYSVILTVFNFNVQNQITKQDYIKVQKVTSIKKNDVLIQPNKFYLHPNYPNPFNHKTNIEYCLPKLSEVCISIYNLIGQEIVTKFYGKQGPGVYVMQWDGRDSRRLQQPSGIYIYRIIAGKFIDERKMILLK